MFSEDPVDFLNSSSIGIHAITQDGTIIYANDQELKTLGYERDEYVGHNAAEFHRKEPMLSDMMTKLSNFQILRNYPVKVQAKNGMKYFLYNSSVYQSNGKFVHTRCYATEIEASVYEFIQRSATPPADGRGAIPSIS